MVIDFPRYNSDSDYNTSKDDSVNLKLTKDNQEEVMNVVNAMMM